MIILSFGLIISYIYLHVYDISSDIPIFQKLQKKNPNTSATLEWVRTWDDGTSSLHYGRDVTVDSERYVYIIGDIYLDDAKLIKYNDSGDIEWIYSWGLANGLGRAVAVNSKDEIIGVGRESGNIVVRKLNNSGYLNWSRSWGELPGVNAYDIAIDSRDNIYLAGGATNVDTNYCLWKYNDNGTLEWYKLWNGIPGERAWGSPLIHKIIFMLREEKLS